jgi:hypothetical protein
MSAPLGRAAGLAVVAVLALVGLCAGLVVGFFHRLPGQPPRYEVQEYPLPYHVPKYEGGVSLRFAMVHDVIHERFPRHGEAYYRERNRLARQALADKQEPHSAADLALFDDLGAGLDYLKQHDEAVRVLRDKLREQEARGYKGRPMYTTYANLGTFLIHGNARAALAGDATARERLREGLEFIHESIAVNPEAHFGREVWQAVAAEYLLAVSANPKLLLQYDMVGDSLTNDVDPSWRDSFSEGQRQNYGRMGGTRAAEAALKGEKHGQDRREWVRDDFITKVGAEEGWNEAVHFGPQKPVPFDEPTLGIIGMWRLGGGANPHFALALGEIMLRVGQRYIAWTAYERAAGLADRAWPDADIRRQFVEHCRRRQKVIEGQLSADEVKGLRPRFEAELAHGQRYQKEYQEYEAERIGAGKSLDDPQFYDDFNAAHPPIASPVGAEETYVAENESHALFWNWPVAVFAAGVSASVGALVILLGDIRSAARARSDKS